MMLGSPWWLLAVPAVPAVWWFARRARHPAVRFPSLDGLERVAARGAAALSAPRLLRLAALLLVVLALARPQQGLDRGRLRADGIDIVLVMDVSTSMLAEDFQLAGRRANRLAVVKSVVKEFVGQRPNDRIGVVVFGARPYTACPLTLDHGWLMQQMDRIEAGMVEDGTAIGSGIAAGLNRLRRSKAKSRVMVLLTDGVNNKGRLSPEAAADLARSLDVKIYAIGAGTTGPAPYPARDMFGRKTYQPVEIPIDDMRLLSLARATGGLYFRATNTESLRDIYAQIDRMETTTAQQPKFLQYRDWYAALVVPAVLLLLAELAMSQWLVRVLP
jgi:Ca-activated chloride channel family protein